MGNVRCPVFPACLETSDISIEIDTAVLDIYPLDPPESYNLTIEPVTLPFSEYCNYPPAPTPNFTFPDSLCLGEAATTISLNNRLAQAREWHLTGPNTDSVLLDSFEFSFHFTQPGEYQLSQTVWALGCRYDFEHTIAVLPPLSVSIGADSLLCPENAQEITAQSSPRSASFTWSNGYTGTDNPISTSGTYAVTATDGFCEATTTTTVVVAEEFLNGFPPFILPADTISCLPVEIAPESQFADQFFTNTDPTPRTIIRLEETGNFRIGTKAFGCTFWDNYNFTLDCQADIYLPTIFSPNNDGINDEFYPMGQDFETLELLVFDRWGGLRYRGEGPSARWDGGEAGQGVYTWFFTYRNTLTGEQQHLEGSVTVVR
jgi:gliding motility-associated-like protein